MPPNEQSSAVPAQLSLLAIYNPSLGTTDKTLHDQIVFYHSKSAVPASSKKKERGDEADTRFRQENEHEKLRQIGLAQGMVSFAKTFSDGESVDQVQTEKSRIVLHELETGWWILAKIDLTRLPLVPSASAASQSSPAPPRPDYTSREVAPPLLICQQLVKAHSVFLLHHASSLDDLYARLSRTAFCAIMERFWTRFIWNWDVLLNGSPVVDILNGIKLAGGGELGFGVGEEEWGSGEREVLEGFVSRTEGLTDVAVSRFGDAPQPEEKNQAGKHGETSTDKYSWVGCDNYPGPHDGVIFSGIGTISRQSLTQVSQWMEWIYRYGKDAYGVWEDPNSIRRRKRKKASSGNKRLRERSESKGAESSRSQTPGGKLSPGIPPPLVVGAGHQRASSTTPESGANDGITADTSTASMSVSDASAPGTDTFMKILTLGYGSTWGSSSKSPSHPRVSQLRDTDGTSSKSSNNTPPPGSSSEDSSSNKRRIIPLDESPGHFILGLRDDPENDDSDDGDETSETGQESATKTAERSKILTRTLTVMLRRRAGGIEDEGSDAENCLKTVRVVVYLYQPFMFTFLFDPDTPSLSSASFYRSIHHQLGPLQKPLLSSTSPDRIHERLTQSDAYQGTASNNHRQHQQIYDVIFDRSNRTLHSSLPNIPEPGSAIQKPGNAKTSTQQQSPWSRLDALNVHAQLVNTYIETRSRPSEIERTCKTSRGWWVLWMRLRDRSPIEHDASSSVTAGQQSPRPSSSQTPQHLKEAFLVRKASDCSQSGHGQRGTSGPGFFQSLGGLSTGGTQSARGGDMVAAPGKIGEGVGLDARRYIEAMLSLGR